MTNEEILDRFNALPPEGQRQVIDLMAFLQQRYGRPNLTRGQNAPEPGEEGFIGMWQDREDMQDSVAWVRDNRKREWIKQGG